jgi:hypothetical protein
MATTKKSPRKNPTSNKKENSRFTLASKAKQLLWNTTFDKNLLRVIPSPLAEHPLEYQINVDKKELEFAVFWEYRREIKHEYDLLRQLEKENYQPSKGGADYLGCNCRWRAEHAATWMKIADIFPLPISEIRKAGFLEVSQASSIKAFKEISTVDYSHFQHRPPPSPWSIYAIQVDWDAGVSEIKKQISKWLDSENKTLAKRDKRSIDKRGSEKHLLLERRLHQLAALRAFSTGLKHDQYLSLKPTKNWSDPSAYRNGHKKAKEVLLDLLNREGWMLFSGR